ncbi:glycosyl hydrolase family 28-related protein [Streptomyces sp. NPDC059718]
MARHLFGLSPADVTVEQVGEDMKLRPGSEGTVWDSLAGGSQLTDLTDLNGNPITVVTSDAYSMIAFYGPSDVATVYVDFGLPNGRMLMSATDLGASITDLETNKAEKSELPYFNVKLQGAVGNGTADDSSAIQAAINAASALGGGTVYVPSGTYKISTPLIMATKVQLVGDGKGASVLSAPANDLITFTANAFWWGLRDLTLKVLGGGHVLAGSHNLSAFTISRCSLQQLGADYSIWYQHSGQIVEAYVSFCDLYVDGDPRTVPAFDWSDPAGGFNANVIEKCVATVNGDDSQYFFKILGTNTTSDYTYNNAFRDVVFETCSGGGIYATSQFGLVIDNCWMWDDPVGGIVAPPFYVGKETSGLASRCTVIRNSGRIGDHLASGVKDLVLHGSCQQTTIDSFRCVPDNGKVDLGDSSYVQFINKSPGTTLTGTASYVAYAAEGDTHNGVAVDGRVTGDAHPRMVLKVDGSLQAGPGTTAPDLSLYRGDVGLWWTDESVHVDTDVTVGRNLRVGSADVADGAGVFALKDVTTEPATAPSGGLIAYSKNGTLVWQDSSGNSFGLAQPRDKVLLPSAAKYETFSRLQASTAVTLVSGQLFLSGILLPKGQVVSNLSYLSDTTAAVSPTHWWFALLDSSLNLLAVTANQTTTAWAASTLKTLPVATIASGAASSFTTTYTGLHYIGVMVAASTVPTLVGGISIRNAALLRTPYPGGLSTTALTTPPTFPFTAAAPSGSGNYSPQWAYVS